MAMTLRLTEAESEQLRRLAEAQGVSQHEVVRRAIAELADRVGTGGAVQESGSRVVTRYAALLDRLSQ